MLGFDPGKVARFVGRVPRYLSEARAYARAPSDGRFPLHLNSLFPVLEDHDAEAGGASGQYFHQDIWAARKIFARKPARHIDIGSRLDGFVAHVLVFMPIEVIDVRPLTSAVPGLTFTQADAPSLKQFASDSVSSISTLHAVEHFGLGRYGDPINPNGWRDAVNALREGNTVLTDGPIFDYQLDADGRHNPNAGAARWHDAASGWENADENNQFGYGLLNELVWPARPRTIGVTFGMEWK